MQLEDACAWGVLYLRLECADAVAATPAGAAPDRLGPPPLERSAVRMGWGMSGERLAAVCEWEAHLAATLACGSHPVFQFCGTPQCVHFRGLHMMCTSSV